MKQLGRVLWWAGPWIGLAFFAWRQQTLEANLSGWVAKTEQTMRALLPLMDVREAEAAESEAGIVR